MNNNFSTEERNFLERDLDLKRCVQTLYNYSRELAQEERWKDHLDLVTALIPCFEYLKMDDWIARIFGRMAWSYLKLNNEPFARELLRFSAARDAWQGAANYYWASEHCLRSNQELLSQEFQKEFRRNCETLLGPSVANTIPDLDLAVRFYRELIEKEAASARFSASENQSDRGRYHELCARLTLDPNEFSEAADHYEAARLFSYAASCRTFYNITLAVKLNHEHHTKRILYERALHELTENTGSDNGIVKRILTQYLKVRIRCCDLIEHLDNLEGNIASVELIESDFKYLHTGVRGSNLMPQIVPLFKLAIEFPSLNAKRAWKELLEFFDGINTTICPLECSVAEALASKLDRVQPYLPSLTFLETPEE